jgi:choline dehydrogenase-like flavoprotein
MKRAANLTMIVVGSGPAAAAAAHALAGQGHQVIVLDVGKRLEPERAETVTRMSAVEPSEWSDEDLACVAGEDTDGRDAVRSKKIFGSSYCLETRGFPPSVEWPDGRGFCHSLAFGGLSNVWGAVLLPYRQSDMADWPVTLEELAPHYRAVMEFVPGTAVADDLEELLPSYSEHDTPLEPSRQASELLDDLRKNRSALRESGIHFGRSRLALHASDCRQCAGCLSGCAYGLIYSSARTMQNLIAAGQISYRAKHLVEKVEDLGDEVLVKGRDPDTGKPFEIRASRVFIGAGVLPTAKIVLESLEAYDRPVSLKDSQYFIYPLLRSKGVADVTNERLHTSAQVFMEIDRPALSPHLVHLQIYGHSSFLTRELGKTFLRIPLKHDGFRDWFLGRLMIVQGYLHSRHSGTIRLCLKKTGNGGRVLEARTQSSFAAFSTVLKVGWTLLRNALKTGAWPLVPGLRISSPGLSYHSGGSFPMSVKPGELQTDVMGRLPSMPRVHLVDASVFPCIPATSITFSVMANAHRIATLAGRLDPP